MFERFIGLLCLSVVTALPAAAQWSLSSHVASDGTLAGAPVVAGASLTTVTNNLGIRIGASLDAGRTPLDGLATPQQFSNPAVFTADFDALFLPTGTRRTVGLEPYAILGLGVRADQGGSSTETLTGSYGGGLNLQLAEHFGLHVETRRRIPLNASSAANVMPISTGWEYRVGFSIRLGGRSKPRPAPRPRPIAEAPPRPVPARTEPSRPPEPAASGSARAVLAAHTIDTADDHVGVPYRWGGSLPSSGFDCSGFVQYVYRKNGVTLPRVSRQQAHAGYYLSPRIDVLEPGDLMFFAGNGSRIDHVAIYVGDGRILHAAKSRGAVAYDNLWSDTGGWFRRHFVAARRVLQDGANW